MIQANAAALLETERLERQAEAARDAERIRQAAEEAKRIYACLLMFKEVCPYIAFPFLWMCCCRRRTWLFRTGRKGCSTSNVHVGMMQIRSFHLILFPVLRWDSRKRVVRLPCSLGARLCSCPRHLLMRQAPPIRRGKHHALVAYDTEKKRMQGAEKRQLACT